MPRHCYVLRVFAEGPSGGNPLGVVTDSSGLRDEQMQAIATELGFSETIFLERWAPGEAVPVRIFTPMRELPFAGHPVVGAAWVLNALGPGGVDRLRTGIGDVAIGAQGETAWAEIAGDRPVRMATTDEIERATAAVGGIAPVDVRWVDMPLPYLLVELASPDDVEGVVPGPALGDLTYVYARGDGGNVRARFFAPGVGVVEDPATGSAAVALAAAERSRGRSSGRLVISQGAEIGRPSRIALEWTPESARISGPVVRDETRWLET